MSFIDMNDAEETDALLSAASPSESSVSDAQPQAPAFKIPSRTIAAVEHPFLIQNLDKGIETFGTNPQFQSVLDPSRPQLSVPLYLHPKDPTSRPMMSHYASSHNVLFKITVPKRTGRKRKRGSNGPWQGEAHQPAEATGRGPESLRSESRLDEPRILRRKLQDNVDSYQAEAVGVIKHTHRYRGMADFNYSMKNNDFMNEFSDKILSGDVSKFRQFAMRPGVDTTPKQEIVAPPLMTQISVPYYYMYSQNPYVRVVSTTDGGFEMVNTTSRVKSVGYFIGTQDAIPTGPTGRPRIRDPLFDVIVKSMRTLLDERPVWTRRSIINRLTDFAYDPENPEKRFPPNLSQQLLKNAIQYAGYQFKGGPWRDALCRYGYDPRKDPSSRVYQCLIFRLRRLQVGEMGEMWQELRKRDLSSVKATTDEYTDTHLFNGKNYADDGKVWQVCDITDPLLAKLFADAPVRPVCDIEGSGWFHRGLWAKARAIMKCKMRAIQFGRVLKDSDFEQALQARDDSPDPDAARSIAIPTPDLKLTDKELELIRGKKYNKGIGRKRHNKRTSYHFPGRRVKVGLGRSGRAGGPSQSQEGDGDETALEDYQEPEDGDETGIVDGLPTDFEDGSEYDEDEGDEDEDLVEGEDYGEDDEDDEDDEMAEQTDYQAFQTDYDEDEDEEQDLEADDADG
ncbi:hypothetical protein KVR01_011472 [Diaporthe batatas]|uniref:uncharacterized protein n=1 Tax=Diaporthe batatas TaxID=748121 RepID=UPI001D05B8A1|nr:uncharacterized protein KVR01_011472 [Diaporthe batatas]KAG8159029.1 hypothetical protein KVR01_011472 [Diaporthe batatas]